MCVLACVLRKSQCEALILNAAAAACQASDGPEGVLGNKNTGRMAQYASRAADEMSLTKDYEPVIASEPPSRRRAAPKKVQRNDRGQRRNPAPARRSLGAGEKPRTQSRGALETPSVQSVERALSLLDAVAASAEPVPLARLTEALGIDQSSVFRLANTLKRRGFLANPNAGKRYVLGPAIWRLSREYDWSRMLISICREPVKALATRSAETAHLAVREGREVLFIDHHASGEQGVIVPGQTGKLMPLHCTGHGKALLADFGLAELKALYGATPLERYTVRTIVSLPDLAKACAQVRADGCSIDDC